MTPHLVWVDRARGYIENEVSVARWTREELDAALSREILIRGPYQRVVNGRTQHFAFVHGWGPRAQKIGTSVIRSFGRADTKALRAAGISDDEVVSDEARRRICWGVE